MTFADLPDGESIFLDANPLVYHFAPHPTRGAAAISIQHGLLSNDALLVALMQAHGLTNLASGDADFDRVPGFTRYGPV